MENQKSVSLVKPIYRETQLAGISLVKESDEFNQNYIIYRVKLEPIEVSVRGRDAVISSLEAGARFTQLGEYTVMLNSITSIEPLPKKKTKNEFNPQDYEQTGEERKRAKIKLDEIKKQHNFLMKGGLKTKKMG